MRKLLLAIPLALVACTAATTIQDYTVKICGFLPTAAAVAGVLHASPKLTTPISIAQAICDALAAPKTFGFARPLSGTERTVYVRGVRVTGHFVR